MEIEGLEKAIEKLEKQKKDIQLAFEKTTLSSVDIQKLSIELGEIEKQIETNEDRWLELSDGL